MDGQSIALEETLRHLRPARARIDLDRLAANYGALQRLVSVPVMPVVKADAYGHGALPVARRLLAAGAPLLAVAYVEEAMALREEGFSVPIVVLAAFGPGQERMIRKHDLTPVVSTPRTLEAVLGPSRGGRRPLSVHLKVDTGMSRLGFTTAAFVEAAQRLTEAKGLELEGVMTHLANADEDREATARQLDRFDQAVAALHQRGIRPKYVHACNSAGLALYRPTHSLVRPGLLLYGLRPRPLSPEVDVRPVMTVSADIALIKDIPEGTRVSYGRRVPVRGTVCMDLTMVELTDRPEVAEGDEAILVGDQPGAWEVADRAGTNAWEVVTRIGPRVPRVYVESGRVTAVQSPFVRA